MAIAFNFSQGSMEQNLISHHSSGRNYRSKVLDKKRVLQSVLLVGICMWLLYKVNNSHHQHESYNVNPQNPSERNITIVLGRKGMVKDLNGPKEESQDKNGPEEFERREDGGVGDDEIDVKNNEDAKNVLEIVQEETGILNGGNEAAHLAKSHFEIANEDSEIEIVDDIGENVHRVEAFLDENGIPPDAYYFINPTSYEPRGRA
ncbi:hypothetical protein GH714_020517 [Hevea brasiliensis]|uniref:Uncharacterized protein n=1 Tax=Hevea brasiliensis TaxID=3981 RepID=A0A6A6LM65_HEVBR|nr:hypothetical protein GH714_020517 [Hevea brasiliensis]